MNVRFTWLALAGLGAVALAGAPTAALAQSSSASLGKFYFEDVDVEYDNTVNVDINKEVDVEKDLDYNGTVTITGIVTVSEAALSLIDNKQIIDDNFVNMNSEQELDNEATVDATVLLGATGNVGLNVAVGDNILQENAAALAAVGAATGGSADAEVFSVQKSFDNEAQWDNGDVEVDNTVALLGDVLSGASGNAGLNISAGAYNAQKNAMALAAVTGTATLSEATAAVLQESTFNNTHHNDTDNAVTLSGNVAGTTTGNIGINLSAGTNNLQQNTLAISSVQ